MDCRFFYSKHYYSFMRPVRYLFRNKITYQALPTRKSPRRFYGRLTRGMETMTKSDLAEQLMDKHDMTYLKAFDCVSAIFDRMTEALVEEDHIELRGFGSFKVRHYKAYLGRNPKSGELVHVNEKKLPHFKMGKWLAVQLTPDLLTKHPTFLNNRKTYTPEELQDKIKNPNQKHFHNKPVGRGGGI